MTLRSERAACQLQLERETVPVLRILLQRRINRINAVLAAVIGAR